MGSANPCYHFAEGQIINTLFSLLQRWKTEEDLCVYLSHILRLLASSSREILY